ncbi:MAG: hypothetical protein ACRDUX_01720 [Mycobacterium sp.]
MTALGRCRRPAGQLGADLLWVNAGEVTDEELGLLARHGGAIVCTPEIEGAQMTFAPVANRVLRQGVPVAFGPTSPQCSTAT